MRQPQDRAGIGGCCRSAPLPDRKRCCDTAKKIEIEGGVILVVCKELLCWRYVLGFLVLVFVPLWTAAVPLSYIPLLVFSTFVVVGFPSRPVLSFSLYQARQDITSAAEELAAVRLTKKDADEALLGKDKENNKVSQSVSRLVSRYKVADETRWDTTG